ncbi:hypothetical protein IP87_01840 [beta proteobacterium AAP121]|nr:hypothetical protein IP80_02225 [beta proteobacterium AAP65]KPG00616.1 hypothetical protein IP87_01840 [beta proteobacterium AAP121]
MPQIPPLIKNLMLACLAIFCLQQLVPLERWLALYPLNSGFFMPWQLLSYALLHFDLMHLSLNLLGLWMFGSELERYWGQKRLAQLLVVSAVTAALCQLAFTWLGGLRSITEGASGALYGLLLAYALSFPERRFDLVGLLPMLLIVLPYEPLRTIGIVVLVVMITSRHLIPIPPVEVPALVAVAVFGLAELLLGLFVRSQIAHFAHLGGMLGALVLISIWRRRLPFGRRR